MVLAVGSLMGGLGYWWLSAEPPVVAELPTLTVMPPDRQHVPVSVSPLAHKASAVIPEATLPTMPLPPRIPRHRDPAGDQTPDLSDHVNEGETPTMAEVIGRLQQAGVTTGLGAFSPPGTRPPLMGLAVPEDFVLPPGYVRHYQATDDGRRIEPILMYSPDHPPLDASGQPVLVPEDRVVPPEMAPQGLPLRRIVVPAPLDPAGRQR